MSDEKIWKGGNMSGVDERPKKKKRVLISVRGCPMCNEKTRLISIKPIAFPNGVYGIIMSYKCPHCFGRFSITKRLDIPSTMEDIEIVR